MNIGLLLITHNNMGLDLLTTATTMLGKCPLKASALPIPFDCNLEQKHCQIKSFLEELDQGDGVLILTDIYGSTPSNIACTLLEKNQVRIVAGLNLPMLIRIFNYPQLDLKAMVQIAESGGHAGIVSYPFTCK